MEMWKWKALCNEAPFRFEKNLASIRTRDPVIRNFCLDILNSGPSVGREKRHRAVEDIDSSALVISSWCALYVSVILGKLEVHPIFGGKKLFKNITHQILNFILES